MSVFIRCSSVVKNSGEGDGTHGFSIGLGRLCFAEFVRGFGLIEISEPFVEQATCLSRRDAGGVFVFFGSGIELSPTFWRQDAGAAAGGYRNRGDEEEVFDVAHGNSGVVSILGRQ